MLCNRIMFRFQVCFSCLLDLSRYSCVCVFLYVCIHSFIFFACFFVRAFVCSCVRLFVRSFVQFARPFARSIIRPFLHSFVRSFSRSSIFYGLESTRFCIFLRLKNENKYPSQILGDKANAKMLLRKHLTPELFEALKDKKTSRGVTLWDCINSGVVNLDSGTGIYAGDEECYTVFKDLFDKIVEDYHSPYKLKVSRNLSWIKLQRNSIRPRVEGRSLSGLISAVAVTGQTQTDKQTD